MGNVCYNLRTMAITANAKKAHKQSLKKRVFNLRRQRTMRDEIKEVQKLVAEGATDKAQAALSSAYQAIDKAAKRGVIKDNTAGRKKSRLAGLIKRGK